MLRRSDIVAMEAYFDALLLEPEVNTPVERSLLPVDKQSKESIHKPLQQLLNEVAREPGLSVVEPSRLVTHLPKIEIKTVETVTVEPSPKEAITKPQFELSQQVSTLNSEEVTVSTESEKWQNIETEEYFQVLFFVVAGVTFGIPLTELGGIHRSGETTPLFGKPSWFTGVRYHREDSLYVVDTIRWIMPEKEHEPEYKYLIMLGDTSWGLSAEQLIGTDKIQKKNVLWRTEAAKRPWLAGMIKDKMCALLHVSELVLLLQQGIGATDEHSKVQE